MVAFTAPPVEIDSIGDCFRATRVSTMGRTLTVDVQTSRFQTR